MNGLAPHQNTSRIQFTRGMPTVLIPQEVLDDMWTLIRLAAPNEVAWLGLVRRRGNRFIIDEVFLPDQEVTCAEAIISTDGQNAVVQELLLRENGHELFERIRFHGHSHVRGPTVPSGTDDEQLRHFMQTAPWFVRGIANVHGKLQFTIFLKQEGVVIDDAPWEVYRTVDAEREARWRGLVDDLVRERPVLKGESRFGLPSMLEPVLGRAKKKQVDSSPGRRVRRAGRVPAREIDSLEEAFFQPERES